MKSLLASALLFTCSGVLAADNLLDWIDYAPSSAKVEVTEPDKGTISVEIPADAEDYPGFSFTPKYASSWDLSPFAYVEATVKNTGETPLPVSLRLDNDGDWKNNPWNSESIQLDPGATGTVRVWFGYSFGFQEAFALDASKIARMLLFTERSAEAQSFVVETLVPGGNPGDPPRPPEARRIAPENGELIGMELAFDAPDGVEFGTGEGGQRISLRFTGPAKTARILPPGGAAWDFRSATEVRVRVRNSGDSMLSPGMRVHSRGGATSPAFADKPIPAGGESDIVVPFAAAVPWTAVLDSPDGEPSTAPETGTDFASDIVSAIEVLPDKAATDQAFEILSIRADATVAELPDWLGTRPPAAGEWVETFREDFDTPHLDTGRWNIYTANYWDKASHFSRKNVAVENGVARLTFERRTGPHNDSAEGEVTDYATGYLDTFGNWTQQYGYFEARMKLPTAQGLWPAFWMMPDRGPQHGQTWQRSYTGDGGMEFDILEYLSGWGPHRYHVAFHWGGYDAGHKNVGTSNVYFRHDAEGYVTAGLLWLPGLAEYYCNGELVGRWESPRVSNVPSYLIFTFVSGGWDNSPLDDETLPDDLLIDYVRCWQRKDLVVEPE